MRYHYSSAFRCPTVDSGRSCPNVLINPLQFQIPVTKLTLELVIKMAKDIKDVSWIHGMDMYASVSVREGTIIKHRSSTSIAFGVYKDPIWDHAISYNGMMMVTRDVIGPSGKVGTLSFSYRFLNEQEATIPPAPLQPTTPTTPPTTTPQPFIIYVPIPHQSFGSPNQVNGASPYGEVHVGAHPETSSGIHPVYIQPSYQSHGHQQFPTMPPH
ncbi:hypothetical protein IGI04_012302 [Brassica rapa subsp. trilocularis]|uniref:Uncharacterized protein n=1 Tax=Brassica rapa subsp. trilocularis TaxID=1813537 RepID=A0ABQ7N6C4_BRACM|nr:hypothetical protein IGI04_012302 [Brassica rapa subsp. trilocularis]